MVMSYIVYMVDIFPQFDRAHKAVWEHHKTTSLPLQIQADTWKSLHKARIFGGPYDQLCGSISYRGVGLEFENKADFVLFMLLWS
jgi:hypothetical protein